MATKTEANSRNGTLSINQQTLSQRAKFGSRFRNGMGVGVDNTASLFPSSPIGNEANRAGVTADGQTIAGGNVYSMFATAIDDSEDLTAGFGFGTSDISAVSLNYRHVDNPFLDSKDYSELTTGAASDEEGLKKHFLGYPDLVPPNIDSVTTQTAEVASADLARGTNQAPYVDKNFGSETSADRQKSSESSSLGFFANDGEGNLTDKDDETTLGAYFKNIGSQGS